MNSLKRLGASALRRLWLSRNRHAFADRGAVRKPRLAVDVSVICRHDAATGIQRVVRSVWSHLSALDDAPFEVVPVYADKAHGYCFAPGDFLSPGGRKLERVPVGLRTGDRFLGLDLAAHHLPNFREQLAAWRSAGASVHIVVYDLLPLTRPDWFHPRTSLNFSRWLDVLRSEADRALCISDYVAQELRRRTANSHSQLAIGRLHLSGDIAGSMPTAGRSPQVSALLEHAGGRPAILMVGTIEPRKGYDRALDAFEQLWASDPAAPDLIIVGKPGWKTAALQQRIRSHPEHGHRLHWLDKVSDEALTGFYHACLGMLAASHDEGLGLPLLEAATHRRWILARDIPVFREQALANVRYFADDSADALAGELASLVQTALAGPAPIAKLSTWSSCVDRLIREIGFEMPAAARGGPQLRIAS